MLGWACSVRMAQSILELQKNAVPGLPEVFVWSSWGPAGVRMAGASAVRLRMLNLGEAGETSTGSTWKVLVYDKFCQERGLEHVSQSHSPGVGKPIARPGRGVFAAKGWWPEESRSRLAENNERAGPLPKGS